MISGTGRRPVVYLLEVDGIGSTACMARRGTLGDYEALLSYEIDRVSKLPHAVVYMEAGYSDANSVGYTARALNRIGDRQDPWLLHQRHAPQLDDQGDPLGGEDLAADPRRAFHRQHRPERKRPEAQPPPSLPGRRGSVQPARPRPRAAADDHRGVPERRRADVDAHAGQQQRLLPRRALAGDVLARPGARPGRPRELPPRPGLRERPVLAVMGSLDGDPFGGGCVFLASRGHDGWDEIAAARSSPIRRRSVVQLRRAGPERAYGDTAPHASAGSCTISMLQRAYGEDFARRTIDC